MKSSFRKLKSHSVDGLHAKWSSRGKHHSADDVWNEPQGYDKDDASDLEEEYDELEGTESELGEELSPWPGYLSPDALSDEEDKDFETALQRIFFEPTPLKLVSAIKGSRQKEGISSDKLTVSWAPDVYDPIPTIVSHTRGTKQQKSKKKEKEKEKDNKRTGKKGQKGGGKGASASGKDKKQYRKNSRDRYADESADDAFGGSDSYCGDSFLKSSHNNVHFSIAEAL